MTVHHELLIELLRTINRSLSDEVKQLLAQHELPLSSMLITRQIKLEPGISLSELARKTGIAKSHVSNVIKDLTKRGWVEKQPDPRDQRLLRLFLSPLALHYLGIIGQDVRQHFSALLGDLSENRSLEIIKDLQELLLVLESAQGKELPHD